MARRADFSSCTSVLDELAGSFVGQDAILVKPFGRIANHHFRLNHNRHVQGDEDFPEIVLGARRTEVADGNPHDGAAFPFVMLGLGLLGLHELGTWGWRWLAIDVVWSLVGGLFIGALLGTMIGRLVVNLRTRHQEAVGLDEFLALGLVALAFGVAQLASTYGFLAVFAAGLALQRVKERSRSQTVPDKETADLLDKDAHLAQAIDPDLASAYMMQAVRGFNEQLERIAELVIVLAVGAMLAYIDVDL